ncbi:hypothetical protein FQN60_003143 [Etheostoma spectabile]|uniref:Uncharacterized protein n=1 Tax=Etheostoma spectabile TaxID=54343 RepID=A0A5J5CI79_9PERO|nr:hypothetical protein FQN60_003143 [Etheostoma spectabile]
MAGGSRRFVEQRMGGWFCLFIIYSVLRALISCIALPSGSGATAALDVANINENLGAKVTSSPAMSAINPLGILSLPVLTLSFQAAFLKDVTRREAPWSSLQRQRQAGGLLRITFSIQGQQLDLLIQLSLPHNRDGAGPQPLNTKRKVSCAGGLPPRQG